MKKLTRAEVIDLIFRRVEREGLRATARLAGVDAGYLCHVLNGDKPLSDEAAGKLGFERLPDSYVEKVRPGVKARARAGGKAGGKMEGRTEGKAASK
jgi:hypothetical protein